MKRHGSSPLSEEWLHRKNRAMGNLGHWEEKKSSDRRKAERTTRTISKKIASDWADEFRVGRIELLAGKTALGAAGLTVLSEA